jgi:DNA-binding ferritin-like protein
VTPLVLALSQVWANLRAEHQLFWAYHWRAKGSPYYGDHLLFQRLYEARLPEIDRLAETLMAVGGPAAVEPMRSWEAVKAVIESAERIQGSDTRKSIAVVQDTLHKLEQANAAVGASKYPLAVNNVLAGIADAQLTALYLLQQRSV